MAVTKKRKPVSNAAAYGNEPKFFEGMPSDEERKSTLALALSYYAKAFRRLDHTPFVHQYAKENFSANEFKIIKKAPQDLIPAAESKLVRMILTTGWVPNVNEITRIMNMYNTLLEAEKGYTIKSNVAGAKVVSIAPKMSPAERVKVKVNDTILTDLEEVVDKWAEGDNKATFDVYTRMKELELKGPIPTKEVVEWANKHRDEFISARDKTDEQLAEAYSHLTKTKLNQRIKVLDGIIKEAQSFGTSQKVTRAPRKKSAPKVDKQLAKLQYLSDSTDYHVASINPIMIVGAMRLYTFNTANRELTEYVCLRREGFEVKGTTLLHVDMERSRKIKLRDPGKTLPLILKGTMRQIDNVWKKLTTATTACRTRINKDMILLKVGK